MLCYQDNTVREALLKQSLRFYRLAGKELNFDSLFFDTTSLPVPSYYITIYNTQPLI